MAEDVLTQDPPYRKKVYDLLKSNFSDFRRTEEEFYKQLDTDTAYADKVYGVLSQNFSDFRRPKEEFVSMLGKPVAPSPQQPPAQRVGGGGAALAGSGEEPTELDTPSGAAQQPAPVATAPDATKIAGRSNLFRNYWKAEQQRDALQKEMDAMNFEEMRGLGSSTSRVNQQFASAQDAIRPYKEAVATMKPMFDREIDAVMKDIGDADLTMERDGIKYSDPAKITAMAAGLARRYGLGQDQDFIKHLENRLDDHVSASIIEKDAMDRFEDQEGPIRMKGQRRMAELFKTDDIEAAKAKTFLDAAVARVNAESKREVGAINDAFAREQDGRKAAFAQREQDYLRQVNAIQQAAQSGTIDIDAANQQLEALNQQQNEAVGAFNAENGAAYARATQAIASTNSRYNRRYQEEQRRIISGAEARIKAAAEKFAKEFGDSEEGRQMKGELQKAYKKAWEDAQKARGVMIDATARQRFAEDNFIYGPAAAMGARFGESVIEGLGGALKGIGTTIGDENMNLLGREMQKAFVLPEARSNEFSDLLDAANLAQVSGQLVGGMLPSVAASAGVAVATGGTGTPVAISMLATGAAGWGAETLQISGDMRDRVFLETGSRSKADDAAWKSFVAQVQLAPAYAFEGLPFVGKALDFIPTKPLRIGVAAGTEYGTELLQEIPQSIADKNILAGRQPYEDFGNRLMEMAGSEELKQLLVTMAPISILGASGQMNSSSRAARLEDAVKSYIAKHEVAKYAEGASGQWINSMIERGGDNFAASVIQGMFSGGQIDQRKATELLMEKDKVNAARSEASRLRLREQDARAYVGLSATRNALLKMAETLPDGVEKTILSKRAAEIERSLVDFAIEGKQEYVRVRYADGSSTLLDKYAAMRMLNDPDFILEVAKQIDVMGIDFVGEASQESVSRFHESVIRAQDEMKAKAQADRVNKSKPKAPSITIDGLTPEEAANKEEIAKLQDQYDKAKLKSEITGKPMPEGMTRPKDVEPGPTTIPLEGTSLEGIVGGRAIYTMNTGQTVEGDVYLDGQTVVIETPDRVYEVGNVEDLAAMQKGALPLTAVEPTITVTPDGEFVYSGSNEDIAQGVIVPQGRGLKAIKRDKQGNIKRIVVTDADGNTKNIVGQEAEDLAYHMMLRAVENNQSTLTRDDSIKEEIDAEHARQTQGTPTTKADADTQKGVRQRDGGGDRKQPTEVEDASTAGKPGKTGVLEDVAGRQRDTAAPKDQVPTPRVPAQEQVATDLTEDLIDDPSVLADAYYEDHRQWNSDQNEQYVIFTALRGRVKADSFDRFGDRNKRSASMAKTYFAKKGTKGWGIDQIAQELSENLNREVTTDELVGFMEAYQNGLPRTSPRMRQTADRYKALTGKRLTTAQGAKFLRDLGKPSVKQPEAQEFINDFTDSDGNVNWRAVKENLHALGFLGYTDEQQKAIAAEADRQLATDAGRGEVLATVRADEGATGQGREAADEERSILEETLAGARKELDTYERYFKKQAESLFDKEALPTKKRRAEPSMFEAEGDTRANTAEDMEAGAKTLRDRVALAEKALADYDAQAGAREKAAAKQTSIDQAPTSKQEEPPKTQAGWKREGAKPVDKSAPIADIPITKKAKDAGVKETKEYAIKGFEEYPVVVVREAKGYRAFVKVGDVEVNISKGHPTEGIVVGDAAEILGRVGKEKLDAAVERAMAAQRVKEEGPKEQRAPTRDQAFNGPEQPKTPIGDTKTVTVDGKERTVFNSNGKPIHPTVEGVRNFWRWFGDSKVVDEQGRPLVVYHGSQAYILNNDYEQAYIDLHRAILPNEEPFNAGVSAYGSADYDRFWRFVNFYNEIKHKLSDETEAKISQTLRNRLAVGLKKQFEVFDKSKASSNTGAFDANLGFFFTADKEFAQRFTYRVERDSLTGVEREYRTGLPHIKEVFLRIDKPVNLSKPTKVEVEQWVHDGLFPSSWGDPKEQYLDVRSHEGSKDYQKFLGQRQEVLQSKGYDGVRNKVKFNGRVREEIIVFDPTQIKSATGNYGTFDPSKPSILEQRPTDRAPKTGKPNTDKVIKALADFGVKVVAPRTKQEYQKAIEQFPDSVKSSWGLYDHATRTIYINPDSKDIPNTLFHEAAHPILTALFHNNPTLRDKFFGEIADENMPGAVDADGNPVDMTYREYGAKYADKSIAMRYEEAIAQFAADVTDGKVKVSLKPDSLWQKFKAFIQEILAALGWDTRSIDLSKPTNVREFAAQFKKAMDKGIRITGLTPAEGTTLSLQDDADRLVDGWYSRLDQAVAAKGNTQSGSDWIKWAEARAKEGALSMEEVKWTGLDDFLAGKGDEKVTPQQVREFLKENRVKVEVVEKNDGGFVHKSAWSAEPRMPGEWEVYDHTGASVMRNVVADSADEAVSIAFEEYPDDAKERSDTKFSQYQLPGASNYREVLVTLPPKNVVTGGFEAAEIAKSEQRIRVINENKDHILSKYPVISERPADVQRELDQLRESEQLQIDKINALKRGRNPSNFRSSHFDEPNILVHLRLNDRVGPSGEKVLFIEELQSDFGQQGKKKGFADGGEREKLLAEKKRIEDLLDALPEGTPDAERLRIGGGLTQIQDRLLRLERDKRPPSAPFVTSTDAWVELGMKQAIRIAAQGGYDKIAWTTGEQQFSRWGSQAFAWSKGKTGWRIVGKEQIGGEAFAGMEEALAQEAKESDTIITSKEELRDVVEDVMGRERSDYSPEKWKTHINKMVDGMWERMQNEDSGTTMPRREGMKGFYDKILPAVAKKVSKKLGGDGVVSDTMIGEDQQVGDEIGRQQSIAITPEMRARVGLGVPLMQRPKTTKAAEWNAAVDAATDLNNLLNKGEKQSILDAANLITDPEGRTEFIRMMNEQWGVTTPPAGTKANQKKVSKVYLRDELKTAADVGARTGIADVAKARKAFVEQVKDVLSKDNFRGELSAAQARVITTRAARVNPLNPKIVDRFIAYAERVAADATYAEQMERVRIAQRGATRRNHAQFQSAVNDFLRIDPEAIPEEMMRDYMEAVADMSKPVPSYRAMQDMFYPLMQATRRDDNPKAPPSVGDVETLWETMKQRQVNSFEDYKAMLSDIGRLKTAMRRLSENDKADTQEVEKLIKEIETALAEFEQRFAEDIAFMKERLVEDIVSRAKGIDLTNITEETKALLKQAYELSDAELMGLSPDELVTLSDILDNVEVDGYVDVFRLDPILAKAQARSAAPGINEQIEKAKDIKSQDKRVERMSTKDAAFWEAAIGLGRIAKGAFHQYLVAPLQRAAGDYIKQVQDGRGFFSKLKKKHGINEKALDRIGMMAVYLREYALRFDPALAGKKDDDGMEYGKRDWFNKILKDGDDSVYGPALWRRMQKAYEALPKDADGQVDPQAVYDAYVNETGAFLPKNEVAFLKEAMAWNAENLTGKQRTANYLRGKPFNELMFHVYRKRIDRKKSKDAIEDAPFVLGDNGNVRIASATGKEVTDNSIAPIAFNYEQLFDANLENVARDYHFTPAMRRMNAVMGAVRAEGGKRAKQYMDVAGRNIQDAMNNEFVHGRRDFFDKGVSNLLAAKAKMVFITPFRTLYESIAGYLSYGMRAGTMRGYAQPFKDNAIVMDLMDAVRSPLRNRKNLSKFIEIEKGAMKERGFFEKVTHTFASATEGVLLKPIWYARFQDEFADITGKEFDAKRWKDDEGYRYDNRKAIDRAAVVADAAYEAIVGSTTAAGNRRNIDVGLGKMKAKTTRGRLASFMTGYAYREWLQIADATLGMVQLMKDEGAAAAVSKRGRRLAGGAVGVLVSATTYNFLMELHYAVMNLLSADDDEEKNLALAELDALLSWEGSLREMGMGFTSIAASKYSGAGRQFIKGIGSIMYNSTTDPEKREAIRSLVRNISFQNPYDLPLKNYQDKDGMYRSIAEAIPAVQTAVENFIMLKRSAVIAHEAATDDKEQSDWEESVIAATVIVNGFNALAQFFGGAAPSTLLNRLTTRYSVDGAERQVRKYAAAYSNAKTPQEKEEAEKVLNDWIRTQPEEDRKTLVRAARESIKLHGVDPWYILLRRVQSPEDRAEAAWSKMKGMTPEERKEAVATMKRVGGIATDRFIARYKELEAGGGEK